MDEKVAKLSMIVKRIRESLDLLKINYQTVGQVKGQSIWIFAKKEDWVNINALLRDEERSIVILSDSSINERK